VKAFFESSIGKFLRLTVLTMSPGNKKQVNSNGKQLSSGCIFLYFTGVPLTSALLNLPKGKSLGRSKPATNS
jgi:hypothetical protein